MMTIDTSRFDSALQFVYQETNKGLAEVINQRLFNVASRTVDALKPDPGQEQEARAKIKAYLSEQQSTRIKTFKSGKRKGRIGRAGARANQLERVNLILQARRRKLGLKGLYGQEMRQAEGRFKTAAQVGVGFLKTPFVAVIKGLVGLVKYKKVATRWGRISVWGSKSLGAVEPAKPGISPIAQFKIWWNFKGMPIKMNRIVTTALQNAFNAEATEMFRHTRERLQPIADSVNAK